MSITLPKEVLSKYISPIFIETGTYDGGGVQYALDVGFQDIRSIELVPRLAEEAKQRFISDNRIKIYQGNSAEVLPKILKDINAGVTFWLDAHEFSNVSKLEEIPLENELMAIKEFAKKGYKVFILIDDMRAFSPTDIILIKNIIKEIPNITEISREPSSRFGPEDILIAK